jgi:hypothetical protein
MTLKILLVKSAAGDIFEKRVPYGLVFCAVCCIPNYLVMHAKENSS